ncbi:MAG: hypothetical protein NZ898_08305 [Myxococcota bacterium]|nr:hypothetical protein [Myxococcota bacterium]
MVLLRGEPLEVFLVRRTGRSVFMPGAHVFPGGRLDPTDADPRVRDRSVGRDPAGAAAALGETDDPTRALALFCAAVRETFEEAGVLLGETRAAAVDLAQARAELAAGAPWPDVLDALDATLRLDWLVPIARWVTPTVEPRRFDARFFLARAPRDQRPSHDATETTEGGFFAPAGALERAARGQIVLPPPTLRTLEWLEAAGSVESAFARVGSGPPPLVEPMFVRLDAGLVALVLPGDPLHPRRERAIEGPTRFVLRDGRWRSEAPTLA